MDKPKNSEELQPSAGTTVKIKLSTATNEELKDYIKKQNAQLKKLQARLDELGEENTNLKAKLEKQTASTQPDVSSSTTDSQGQDQQPTTTINNGEASAASTATTDDAAAKLQALSEEYEAFKAKVEDWKEKVKAITSKDKQRIKDLEQKLEQQQQQQQQQTQEATAPSVTLVDAETSTDPYEDEIVPQLHKDLQNTSAALEQATTQIADLNEKLRAQEEKCSQLLSKIHSLEETISRLSAEVEAKSLQEKETATRFEQEHHLAQDRIRELEQQHAELLSAKKQQVEGLEEKLKSELEAERNASKEALDTLQSEHQKKLESIQESHREHIQDLERRSQDQLRSEIEKRERDLQEAQQRYTDAKKQLDDMTSTNIELSEKIKTIQADYESQVSELKQQLAHAMAAACVPTDQTPAASTTSQEAPDSQGSPQQQQQNQSQNQPQSGNSKKKNKKKNKNNNRNEPAAATSATTTSTQQPDTIAANIPETQKQQPAPPQIDYETILSAAVSKHTAELESRIRTNTQRMELLPLPKLRDLISRIQQQRQALIERVRSTERRAEEAENQLLHARELGSHAESELQRIKEGHAYEISALQKQLADITNQKTDAENCLAATQQQLERVQAELAERLQQMEESKTAHEQDLERINAELITLQHKLAEEREHHSQQLAASQQQFEQDKKSLQDQIHQLSEQHEAHQKQHDQQQQQKLAEQQQQFEKEKEDLKAKLESLQKEVAEQTERANVDREQSSAERQTLKARIEELTAQLQHSNEQKSAAEARCDDLAARIAVLESEKEAATSQLQQLERDILDMKEEEAILRASIESIKTEDARRLKETEDELGALKKKTEEWKEKVKTLNERDKQRMEQLKKQLKDADDKIKELEATSQALSARLEAIHRCKGPLASVERRVDVNSKVWCYVRYKDAHNGITEEWLEQAEVDASSSSSSIQLPPLESEIIKNTEDALQSKLAQLQEQLQEKQHEVDKLTSELSAAQDEHQKYKLRAHLALKHKTEEFSKKISDGETTISELTAELRGLKENTIPSLEEAKAELEEELSELKEVKEKLEELKLEVSELKTERDDLSDKLRWSEQELARKMDAHAQQISQLEHKHSTEMTELSQQNEKRYDEFRTELKSLRERNRKALEDKDREIARLQKRMSELLEEHQHLQQQLQEQQQQQQQQQDEHSYQRDDKRQSSMGDGVEQVYTAVESQQHEQPPESQEDAVNSNNNDNNNDNRSPTSASIEDSILQYLDLKASNQDTSSFNQEEYLRFDDNNNNNSYTNIGNGGGGGLQRKNSTASASGLTTPKSAAAGGGGGGAVMNDDRGKQILELARIQASRDKVLLQTRDQIKLLRSMLLEKEIHEKMHLEQEALLKNEIRELERSKNREAANLDYLKNIVVKFLEAADPSVQESLLKVISTILQFSPEETQRVTKIWSHKASSASSGSLWSKASSMFGNH